MRDTITILARALTILALFAAWALAPGQTVYPNGATIPNVYLPIPPLGGAYVPPAGVLALGTNPPALYLFDQGRPQGQTSIPGPYLTVQLQWNPALLLYGVPTPTIFNATTLYLFPLAPPGTTPPVTQFGTLECDLVPLARIDLGGAFDWVGIGPGLEAQHLGQRPWIGPLPPLLGATVALQGLVIHHVGPWGVAYLTAPATVMLTTL
jgi:hypothetical protein